MKPRARDRTPEEKAADEARIAQLRARRMNFRQIAEVMNADPARPFPISFQTVQKDAARIAKRWLANAEELIAQHKADMLAELDEVCREAWQAWEKSKAAKVKRSTDKAGAGDATVTRMSVSTEDQTGDPALLRVLLDAMEKRAKLLGIEMPRAGGPLEGLPSVGLPPPRLVLVGALGSSWEDAKPATGQVVENEPA